MTNQDIKNCYDCGRPVEDKKEIDDEGYCPGCAEEIRLEREHMRQLRSAFYANIL